MKKLFVGMLLCAALTFCLLTGTALAANQAEWVIGLDITRYSGTFIEAVQAANSNPGTTITLLEDITSADFPSDAQNASKKMPFIFTGTNTTLDLSGMTIDRRLTAGETNGNVITVAADASLTLKDSDLLSRGNVTGGRNTDNGGGVIVHGNFTLESGAISDNRVNSATGNGGGVYVSSRGKFTMTGGTISNNKVTRAEGGYAESQNSGGGVYVDGAVGKFIMTAGTISGNEAAYGGGVAINASSFTMSGSAQISGNIASSGVRGVIESRGGGVYIVNNSTFQMTGGVISSNSAKNGCGVYVANGSTFTLSDSAQILNNKANPARNYGSCTGGGVYVMAQANFIMNSGTISKNEADMGGGVCSIGETTMSGGKIYLNTATSVGGGVQSMGGFTMTNGEISQNSVTGNSEGNGYGGGLYVGGDTFDMQGGEISTNKALCTGTGIGAGGGVCVVSGVFTMSSNASVRENMAQTAGGGVYAFMQNKGPGVYDYGTFNLTGGSITRNNVNASGGGGGVYVGNDVFFVSGAPTVSGNSNGNVYLPSGKFVRVKGGLTGGSFYVTAQDASMQPKIAQGVDGYTLTSDDANTFHSDNSSYNVEFVATSAYAKLRASGGSFTISAQPTDQNVTEGQPAVFSVTASGNSALSYQWLVFTNNGAGWENVSGATGDSYTISATALTQNGYQYRCNVSDGSSRVLSSNAATLTVNAASSSGEDDEDPSTITITEQPEDAYVAAGKRAMFFVSAIGEGIQYQWHINRNDGKGWQVLPGATSALYTTSPTRLRDDGYRYMCWVSDANNTFRESQTVTLFVLEAGALPQTGDSAMPGLWLSLLMLSGSGLLLLLKRKKRA